jgi:outer membrane protein OmpA-like peptidoglycan-associated protein
MTEQYRKMKTTFSKGFMIYFYNYWPKKRAIILKNVLFENNKANLLPVSFPELEKLVNMLKQNTFISIEVRGYTDNVGKEKDNKLLSELRAKAVCDYLISKHISDKRLIYKGMGSEKPIASNETEEGRRQNRRVEFAIIMK